ncbi:hypothetical protein OGAPHI_001658 [Ogataea philodendri]|uniref:Sulfite efflux pump SSU1 n=1 Tax=Ogataea philodendri TaxID=1378263 RepID=A0A9P8PBQ8_9ASCO|nr:uncharacterized protein OGAPHI_001658 [Ogataea philodendri]KAH3669062.1 hypothetical protein OGAPHI_001658 [Ogataea philodendri]
MDINGVESGDLKEKSSFFKDVVIKNYHPIWNVAFMTTGICSGVLFRFPYEFGVFRIFGLIMWAISLLLFLMVNVFLILKLYWFRGFGVQLATEIQFNVFLAPYSMGFSTIINMIHLVTAHYHKSFKVGLVIMWFLNFIMALLCGWGLVFVLFWKSKIDQAQLNPQLILPILPLTVCGSCGALICSAFVSYSSRLQLMMILLTYLLWANSVIIGVCLIGIFIWKMLIYKLPPKQLLFSPFAPIGLIGHGAWGIILNGNNLHTYLVAHPLKGQIDSVQLGTSIKFMTGMIGLSLIAIGFFFTFLGFAMWAVYGLPKFNKTYWIVPFPVCALSLGITEFYNTFGVGPFRVVGTIYATFGVLMALCCLVGSVFYEVPYGKRKL